MRHRIIAFAGALAGLAFIALVALFALQLKPVPARPVNTPADTAAGSGQLPSGTPVQGGATPPPPVTAAPAAAALTVEEYPIVAQGVDEPSHFEYSDRISDTIRMRRAAWRQVPTMDVGAANAALARFGDRLLPDGLTPGGIEQYRLVRGETLVLADVTLVGPGIGPVIVSASGEDFAMLVEAPQGRGVGTYLLRAAGVEPWDEPLHAFIRPVFVGDDLIVVERGGAAGEFLVRRSKDVVYTFTAGDNGVENPVKALWAWDGHWVLEVSGQVFVDGQSLNRQLGYDAIFSWQLIDGQPFYFFEQTRRVGVSYAGMTLPYTYDDVVHYRCCEPAVFNVAGNGTMVWFHALRDGIWYYVEMGVYGTVPPVPGATPVSPTIADDPMTAFPLEVGSTWVYSYTRYEDEQHATYVVTDTIVSASRQAPHYAAEVRRTVVLATGSAAIAPPIAVHYWYVISGTLVFRQNDVLDLDQIETSWLEFVFPLYRSTWYPDPEQRATVPSDWLVIGAREAVGPVLVETPGGTFGSCYNIATLYTSGATHDWFCPGVGFVKGEYDHAGSRFGYEFVLVYYSVRAPRG